LDWRCTVASRCTTVTVEAATSAHNAIACTYGTLHGSPVSPVPTSTMISRSARSAMPTVALNPAASARARM
jgi:hypothetical protein